MTVAPAEPLTSIVPVNDVGDGELDAAIQLWRRMHHGSHLDDWLTFIPVLSRGRTACMETSNSNAPIGRRYNKKFGQWREEHFPGMDKAEITALLWFSDDEQRLDTLRDLRATMTVGKRVRLNLPTSARKLVERQSVTAEKEGDDPKAPTWKEKYAAAEQKIAELEGQHSWVADSHFERSLWVLDPDEIASVIVENVTPEKWVKIVSAVAAEFASRVGMQKADLLVH